MSDAAGDDSNMALDPEIEKQLREAAEREDAQMQTDIRNKCQQEFDKRKSLLADQFNASYNSQMSNMGDRYTSHTHDRVTVQQTDVLRSNKAIRDVSRGLGADWKPVFQHLMKGESPDKVKVEMARVERQKPFMQSFKALNTWKDCMGDKFDIRFLVEALMAIQRKDLAEQVLDILENNEIDSLYAMDNVGTGIAGGAAKQQPVKSTSQDEKQPTKPATSSEDPIGDGKLLKIAKAIDKNWVPLAQALGLSEEEIEETKSMAGDTYHGAFKVLFLWRDNGVESGQSTAESAAALKAILIKIGRKDLADTIVSS